MSEPLEWQLDDWIAEKFMGWKPLDFGDLQIIGWEMKDGKVMTWEPTSFGSFKPSADPAAFALVKREIERRGWNWSSHSYPILKQSGKPSYFFEICNDNFSLAIESWGETEELAGCLAVKAAIEAE